MPVPRATLAALASLLLGAAAGHAAPETEPVTLRLRDAVDKALRRNLGLAFTRTDIDRADAAIDIAESAFDPALSIGSGFSRFRSPGADYVKRGGVSNVWTNNASLAQKFSTGTRISLFTGFDPDLTATALASPDIRTRTGLEVRQALLRGASQSVNLAPIARARLNLERSKTNFRITAVNLIRDTEIAYRRLAAAHDLLLIRENSLQLAQSLLNEIRARRRPEIGTATEQDELEAAGEVAARRVEIAAAAGRLAAAADTLRALLGEAPSSDPLLSPPKVERLPAGAPPPAFAGFMADTEAFNPDATLRDIDIRDANTALDAALDAESPSLDVVFGASTLGRGGDALSAISGQWEDNGSQLNAGLVFTMPLGMRESEAAVRSARRARDRALYGMTEARRVAGYAARAAWRDLNNARERLSVAETGVIIRTRAYEGVRARNARGLASVNDVLQAATRLDNARIDKLNAELDHAEADARRARLDGSILARNDLRWDEVDDRAATETAAALDPATPRP